MLGDILNHLTGKHREESQCIRFNIHSEDALVLVILDGNHDFFLGIVLLDLLDGFLAVPNLNTNLYAFGF